MTEVRFRDFSRKPRDISFDADGEHYECVSAVSPEALQDMLVLLKGVKDDPVGGLKKIFELVLEEESAARIVPRLKRGHQNPIDVRQAVDICVWLTEEYSQRPTQPSTSSSNGSATEPAGITSTAGPAIEA